MSAARYAVGIDLGTTNCVMAVIDLKEKGRFPKISSVSLKQRLDEEQIGEAFRLPSFLYIPTDAQERDLPAFEHDAQGWVVGMGAASMGRRVMGRLVTSAKSWLCHSRVDRRQAILPWGAEEEVDKISPVQATVELLRHLDYSWSQSPYAEQGALKDQKLTVTLPASFDQMARELTVQACKEAGLGHARLLEEPQAAFYNWITLKQGRWGQALDGRETVLVCDVGGGTSDFSLIRCVSKDGEMTFEREAVGEHLLLGGDNIDLALAHMVESRLSGETKKLNQSQWQLLAQLTRMAKERLLSSDEDEVAIRLPGSGRKVIGGLRQAKLRRAEVEELILEGFFPLLEESFRPRQNTGVQELGLPYEAEPAVTHHILDFIRRHAAAGFPEAVIFNGGTLEPSSVRKRIVELLNCFAPTKGQEVTVLDSDSLSDAVARGAAYYSFISHKGGLRIGGGCSKAYYLGMVDQGVMRQACIVPKGTEPHESSRLSAMALMAKTNEPVSFELFQSDRYPDDAPGQMRSLEGEAHGRLNTLVRFGRKAGQTIPVEVEGELTELDTLRLKLLSKNTDHCWDLEFDLRANVDVHNASEGTLPVGVDEAPMKKNEMEELIHLCFDSPVVGSPLKKIEKQSGTHRSQWPISFLRSIADVLLSVGDRIKVSAEHEKMWLMATGFSMRPGFGDAGDQWRRQKVWSLVREGAISKRDLQCQVEWAILWRRLSLGLEPGRQSDLYQRNKKQLWDKKGEPRLKGDGAEWWRMLCSMEAMPKEDKLKLGGALLTFLNQHSAGLEVSLWCLGRLGTRLPFKVEAEGMMTAKDVTPWILELLRHPEWQASGGTAALVECCRCSGDRVLDIGPELREKVEAFLMEHGVGQAEDWLPLLRKATGRHWEGQNQLLGEGLPLGLEVRS